MAANTGNWQVGSSGATLMRLNARGENVFFVFVFCHVITLAIVFYGLFQKYHLTFAQVCNGNPASAGLVFSSSYRFPNLQHIYIYI